MPNLTSTHCNWTILYVDLEQNLNNRCKVKKKIRKERNNEEHRRRREE